MVDSSITQQRQPHHLLLPQPPLLLVAGWSRRPPPPPPLLPAAEIFNERCFDVPQGNCATCTATTTTPPAPRNYCQHTNTQTVDVRSERRHVYRHQMHTASGCSRGGGGQHAAEVEATDTQTHTDRTEQSVRTLLGCSQWWCPQVANRCLLLRQQCVCKRMYGQQSGAVSAYLFSLCQEGVRRSRACA